MGLRTLAAAALALLATLVGAPGDAQAQAPGQYAGPAGGPYAQPPPPPPVHQPTYREGFTLGASIGGGSIELVEDGQRMDSLDGLSLHLHLGGMVSEDIAILGDFWGVFHAEENDFGDETLINHDILTLAVQWWATPRFWLKGGVGQGRLRVRHNGGEFGGESDYVPAGMLAAGYEITHSATFALDVQLRFGAADYGDGEALHNGALALGLNWY